MNINLIKIRNSMKFTDASAILFWNNKIKKYSLTPIPAGEPTKISEIIAEKMYAKPNSILTSPYKIEPNYITANN